MGKVVGIDYGQVRIGVAISDERRFLSRPLATVTAEKTIEKTAHTIARNLQSEGKIDRIVIGLPLHLSGKESPMCASVRELGKHLENILSIPIIFWDERLSTAQVERTLKEAELSRKKRVPLVDAMAACAILQNYLDSL
jgi:putative Holliday junction resolvase